MKFLKSLFKHKPEHLLEDMACKLVRKEQEPKEIQQCPICNGELHFGHVVNKTNNKKKIIVLLVCMDCKASISLHITSPIPDWGRELKEGEKVPRPRLPKRKQK